MITVNEAAVLQFKEMAATENNPDQQMLRIGFAGYG